MSVNSGSLVGGIQGQKEGNPQTTSSSQSSTHKPLPRTPSSTLKPAFQLEISMNMEEVLEDSPMFRKKIVDAEGRIEDLGNQLKNIIKASTHCTQTGHKFGQALEGLAEVVSSFNDGFESQDKIFNESFKRFGTALLEIKAFQDVLLTQMNDLIAVPMENFLKNDIKNVKENSKRFEKTSHDYDNALNKVSQVKKTATAKFDEAEQELSETRKQYRLQTLDLMYSMNEIHAKKKFELGEHFCTLMYLQLTYFHQGYEMLTELEPFLRQMSSLFQQTRLNFEGERKQLDAKKKTLEEVAAQPMKFSKTPAITIQGYLFKQNSNMRKDWTKRFFEVKGGHLLYYKTGKEPKPAASVSLLLCAAKSRAEVERRHCFEIVSPGRSFLVQAENEEKMLEWLAVLQNATAHLLNAQQLPDPAPGPQIQPPAPSPSPNPAPNPAPDRQPLAASSNSRTDMVLAYLRAQGEHNRVCADCKAKDPEWASTKQGVLVCIDCSGIHRSLGTHISKVRSFLLDKWEPEQIQLMMDLGNLKANQVFEAEVPPEMKKPNPGDDRPTREAWIKAKYVNKQFVPKPKNPTALDKDLVLACQSNKPEEVLKVLVQAQALLGSCASIINKPSPPFNKTALHDAVSEGNVSTVLLLIQYGVSLDTPDDNGQTPLHIAAIINNQYCACLLVKSGISLGLKDKGGKTALDLAMEHQSAHLVTLLRMAQMAASEGASWEKDDSFVQALKGFQLDVMSKLNKLE